MTELTRFGEVLMDLMHQRGLTLDELVLLAAKEGFFLDDDVLFQGLRASYLSTQYRHLSTTYGVLSTRLSLHLGG